ncbi:extensin-like [Abrus precatorius]|uniref:Extensin-like n=1 Tax=Abrus precatorius TaxID=3816 RepID=A0A8B8MHZ3_ABRPR|nr:extensin-like [Abrus precatorius]
MDRNKVKVWILPSEEDMWLPYSTLFASPIPMSVDPCTPTARPTLAPVPFPFMTPTSSPVPMERDVYVVESSIRYTTMPSYIHLAYPSILVPPTAAPMDTDVPTTALVPDVTPHARIPQPSSPPLVELECIDIHVIESTVRPCLPTPPRRLFLVDEASPSHRSPSPPMPFPLSRVPPPTLG